MNILIKMEEKRNVNKKLLAIFRIYLKLWMEPGQTWFRQPIPRYFRRYYVERCLKG